MTYDRYGNVTQILRNGVATPVPVLAASNHLGAPAAYDASGNLTYRLAAGQPQQIGYDSQNRVQTLQTPEVAKGYVYTADGERLLEIDFGDPWTETWSIRDLSGKVLRQWQNVPSGNGGLGRWSWKKDYIYRGGSLLASNSPSDGVGHYHLDHLGSPRLITDGNGVEVARHSYFPFGEEATDPNQDDEPMKFTGHERDGNGPGTADDLDYMHARYYSPGLCRFMSLDPADSTNVGVPQGWNKYAYVTNRPMGHIDPDGRESLGALAGDRDSRELINGEITAQEFQARANARGAPALFAASLVNPIDDLSVGGLAFEAAAGIVSRSKIVRRVGGFLRRVFRGGDRASAVEKLSREAQKSIRSFEKQISKHEQKLAEFKANPTVRPGMEHLPVEVINQQQLTRIRKLEQEIETFKENIQKILQGEL